MSPQHSHEQLESESRGFFPATKFHLWSTGLLIALSAVSLSPIGFKTTLWGTVLVNWLLLVIMVVALAVLVLDLFLSDHDGVGSHSGVGSPSGHSGHSGHSNEGVNT